VLAKRGALAWYIEIFMSGLEVMGPASLSGNAAAG